ncbi:MAG: hypothetical protein HQK83_19505 [Fibrobacteria bacterium]|nr:hypothetical protein [Fibrobacteria bacterium]
MCNTLTKVIGTIVLLGFLGPLASLAQAQSVFLGSKDVYTNSQEFIDVPVFLNNFEEQTIQSLEFLMVFDGNILSFDTAKFNASYSDTWEINSALLHPDSLRFQITGTSDPISADILHIMDICFGVSNLSQNSNTKMTITSLQVNDSLQADVAPFNFNIINMALSRTGDINGDSVVNMDDVYLAFQKVTDGEINGLSGFLELSNVTPLGVHDVALLYQHNAGLLPSLPLPTNSPKAWPDSVISDSAQYTLSGPFLLSNDIYTYKLNAKNVKGLLSAQISLSVNSTIIDGIISVTSHSISGLIDTKMSSGNSLVISFASPQAVDVDTLSLITLRVRHKQGKTGNGIYSIKSILANEGSILTAPRVFGCTDYYYEEYDSSATIDDGSCKTPNSVASTIMISQIDGFKVQGNIITINNNLQARGKLIFYDVHGKLRGIFPVAEEKQSRLYIPELSPGRYFLRLILGQSQYSGSITIH